jgi:N-acetyl-1-D-myo-inositol-2-amino-2-deoxy-alpha-D-glucopyranoside deacetylase
MMAATGVVWLSAARFTVPGAGSPAPPARARAARLPISHDTKLLVVAPHPDDEVLGGGGLMQHVRAAQGAVHVVYLTDGDGFPEGVEAEDRVTTPTATDYRGYGRRRRHEAREALSALKLGSYTTTFLSFPDGGLCTLMSKYWSDRTSAFRSPYTRLNRPPRAEMLIPDAEYRGEDLTQELARIIGEMRPTMIAVPRREDQHADHCAAWFFVADALGDVERINPDLRVELLNYIIHWDDWPFEEAGPGLSPPPGLRGGISGWIALPLTSRELAAKRDALKKYETQMLVMSWFLDGFTRANEVFSRPATPRVALPVRRSPCCG